jgi:hypothetical protein
MSNDKRRWAPFMLGLKDLEDIFVYRLSEHGYGHNPQLGVG